MANDAVAVAAVVMTGVFLCVLAWQLLAVARAAVARETVRVGSPKRAGPAYTAGGRPARPVS